MAQGKECRRKTLRKAEWRKLLFGPIHKVSSQGIFQLIVGIDRVPDFLRPANADGASIARLIQEDDRELLTLY